MVEILHDVVKLCNHDLCWGLAYEAMQDVYNHQEELNVKEICGALAMTFFFMSAV